MNDLDNVLPVMARELRSAGWRVSPPWPGREVFGNYWRRRTGFLGFLVELTMWLGWVTATLTILNHALSVVR